MPSGWPPKAWSSADDAQALVDEYRDKLDDGEVTTELVAGRSRTSSPSTGRKYLDGQAERHGGDRRSAR